jgi:4-amino-4-deoxy-L-arabinose transferase-like glycosyltransferase
VRRSSLGLVLPGLLAAGGLLIGAADVWLNRVIEPLRHTSGEAVQRLFPQTARLDLLVLVALAILVAAVLVNERDQLPAASESLKVPLLLAGVLGVAGAALLSPMTGLLVPVAFLSVWWIGPRLTDGPATEVRRLLCLALSLRVLVAFGLGLYGLASHSGLPVLDDEESLHRAAIEVAPMLTGGFGYVQPAWWHLPNPYLSLLAGMYAVVGPEFSAVRLLNASLGALSVALVHGMVQRLFSQPAARGAALVLAVWPAVVLWTGTGLRESLFTTCSLLVPWLLTRHLPRPAWSVAAAAGGLAVLVVGTLRNYAAAAEAVGLAVAAMRLRPLLAPVVLVLGLVAWAILPLAREITPRGLEYRAAAIELSTIPETDPAKRAQPPDPANRRYVTEIVRVQLVPGDPSLTTAVVYGYQNEPFRYVVATDENTFYMLPTEQVQPLTDDNVTWSVPLARLSKGLRLLYVPPVPWEAVSIQRLATVPDALAWDALFVLGVAGAWQSRRAWPPAWLVVLVYLVLMILALSLASSNLGTAVRHRGMLVPWLVILSAPALARLVGWLAAARASAPVGLHTPAKLEADGVGSPSSPRRSFLLPSDQPRQERL